jgi:membrane associated rhomboid family serine protease
MFPISDDNPRKTIPYVTYTLIALNLLVFLYEVTLSQPQLERFFYSIAVIPAQLTASFEGLPGARAEFPELATLITSQFLHGGWLHLFGNMLFLWIFGDNVEDELGHGKFLVFYLTCGVLAALTQWFFAPASSIPSLGASGAIAGVMGAYIVKFPLAQILTIVSVFPLRVPAFVFLGIWFLQQALYSFVSLEVRTNIGMESGGIAYWAHAGGFLFGALLALLFGMRRSPSPSYE